MKKMELSGLERVPKISVQQLKIVGKGQQVESSPGFSDYLVIVAWWISINHAWMIYCQAHLYPKQSKGVKGDLR